MQRLYEFFRGTLRMEISGECPEKLLNACAFRGMQFWDCEPRDDYTMEMTIYTEDFNKIKKLAGRAMCDVRPIKNAGGARIAKNALRRRVLVILTAVFAVTLAWSSLYLWDIDVMGNETVSTGEILRALEDEGVKIGTYWPSISSDLVRCGVIPRLEGVSWMTVNVRSSRAEVKVRERVEKPEIVPEDTPCNIVAAKTGIISKMSILRGQAAVEKGAAVIAGETIVSGAVESIANGARTVHAIADVQAHTLYEMTAVFPENVVIKTKTGRQRHRYALIIGQNRINFYSGSRNDTACCDKIIEEFKFAVEGVFTLPVSIVRETMQQYETKTVSVSPELRLKQTLARALSEDIGEGEVIQSTFTQSASNGLRFVTLRAECLENIAKTVPMTNEELNKINQENSEGRTNDRKDD